MGGSISTPVRESTPAIASTLLTGGQGLRMTTVPDVWDLNVKMARIPEESRNVKAEHSNTTSR
jgi:hypothetical protein